MKATHSLTICLLALGLAAARAQDAQITVPNLAPAAAQPAPATPPAPVTFTEAQLLEEFGWFVGKRVGLTELGFSKAEIETLLKGMAAAIEGKDSPYELEKIGPKMDEFIQGKQKAYLWKSMSPENLAYFEKLKENTKVSEVPSGLRFEVVQPGTGAFPTAQDTVKVHYTGKLTNGTVFDSSVERNEPIAFPLADVIPGWTEGMQKINKGGKIKLYVPPYLGYGDRDTGKIPANSILVFDVELLDINPAPEAPPAAMPAPAPMPGAAK